MDYFNIFLLGFSSGLIFSIVSMLLISARNSEKYPVGGFIPSLRMLSDLGMASQIIVAGILVMGGMTGFYLTLTFWKERNILSKNFEKIDSNKNTSHERNTQDEIITTVKGKSLSEFL